MTRFFFNLATRGNTIFDPKGREFADLAGAHRHAMQLVYKMALLRARTGKAGISE